MLSDLIVSNLIIIMTLNSDVKQPIARDKLIDKFSF